MSVGVTGSGDRSLVPPSEVLAPRPPVVRLLAEAATVVWWLAGLLAAGSAVLVVVEPVDARQVATRVAFVGVGLFAVAASASLLVVRLTERAADRREAAEAAHAAAAGHLSGPDLPPDVLAAITRQIPAPRPEARALRRPAARAVPGPAANPAAAPAARAAGGLRAAGRTPEPTSRGR